MPSSVQYESLVKAILRKMEYWNIFPIIFFQLFRRQISFYISFILKTKDFASKKLRTSVLK